MQYFLFTMTQLEGRLIFMSVNLGKMLHNVYPDYNFAYSYALDSVLRDKERAEIYEFDGNRLKSVAVIYRDYEQTLKLHKPEYGRKSETLDLSECIDIAEIRWNDVNWNWFRSDGLSISRCEHCEGHGAWGQGDDIRACSHCDSMGWIKIIVNS